MLSGHIPSCSNRLHLLTLLDVGGNKLWGKIPKRINKKGKSSLEVLRLQGNMFNGTIPDWLCSLSQLRILDLARNQFIGNVPLCLGNLTGTKLSTRLNSGYIAIPGLNSLDSYYRGDERVDEIVAGTLRQYTSSTLTYLTTIDLSSNYLEGPILGELTKLYGLIDLNLSHNHLTGNIPERLGDMKSLETLDLSMNSLSGRIPPSIGNIDFMNSLDSSYNNLSGEIPISSHLQRLNKPSTYAGNPLLCGEPLPIKCSSHEKQPKSSGDGGRDAEDKREKMWFYLVVMSGFATGFWGIVGALILSQRLRHAYFRLAEDAYDWLYVEVSLRKAKLKRILKQDK